MRPRVCGVMPLGFHIPARFSFTAANYLRIGSFVTARFSHARDGLSIT